ncbi:MAG TPA: FxsA family protein [Nitratifractor sp.]|jgi:UPF0716 protein FxsA|nr:FxsA family protein [Nitratifractor sp.]HHH20872.1 FxsA family protein [Nitratifractor sp.]
MLFLLGYFIIELLASIKLGITIGFGWSVVWVVATSIIGSILLRLSPYAIMDSFNTIAMKRFNVLNAQNAAISYVLGAILLIIPGVFSDILGIILLGYTIYLRLFTTIPKNKQFKEGDDDVIDVEIIDSSSSNDTTGKR